MARLRLKTLLKKRRKSTTVRESQKPSRTDKKRAHSLSMSKLRKAKKQRLARGQDKPGALKSQESFPERKRKNNKERTWKSPNQSKTVRKGGANNKQKVKTAKGGMCPKKKKG